MPTENSPHSTALDYGHLINEIISRIEGAGSSEHVIKDMVYRGWCSSCRYCIQCSLAGLAIRAVNGGSIWQ